MSKTIQRTVRHLPTWFVSARNGQHVARSGKHALWRPFGTHHARQIGSPVTACGLWALGWQLFWDMGFPSESAVTCADCRTVVEQADRSKVR